MINVSMVTLGCPKNTVDSEVMLGVMKQNNLAICHDIEQADVVVVNTCGFIETAKQESIETILKINELRQTGQLKGLVVAGCLVNKYQKELLAELQEADAFIGTANLNQVVQAIQLALDNKGKPKDAYFSRHPKEIYDHLSERRQLTPNYFAYLKISEGCSNTCKFCSIPMMRGKNRSRTLESLVEEAKLLAQNGVRELNIIGQDTTDYGTDIYEGPRLAELLRRLSKIDAFKWIRLFYAFPAHLTDEMIDVLANEEKICSYLDMPIQHVDDELLLKMNRKLNGAETLKLIDKLRAKVPNLALRTTFIVGLPGETEAKFQKLVDAVETVRFERLGVFPFSQEEHVPASKMEDQIAEEIKQERVDTIMKIQQKISRENNEKRVGQEIDVLVEETPRKELESCVGRSEWDGPEIDGMVYLKGDFKPGSFVRAKVTDFSDYDLMAEPIGPTS